jgi:hypothetical protein
MANKEHLDILAKRVEAWNKWRKGSVDVFPDLRYADLEDADLGGADLEDADLGGADLEDANFSGANSSARTWSTRT